MKAFASLLIYMNLFALRNVCARVPITCDFLSVAGLCVDAQHEEGIFPGDVGRHCFPLTRGRPADNIG